MEYRKSQNSIVSNLQFLKINPARQFSMMNVMISGSDMVLEFNLCYSLVLVCSLLNECDVAINHSTSIVTETAGLHYRQLIL